MRKISDAFADLAGVIVDAARTEPDEGQSPEEAFEPDVGTQAEQDTEAGQETPLDELDAVIAELEREVASG